MTITITKNIQAHIDLLKSLPNITKVKLESVPTEWKERIGNIDSVMFVVYKNNLWMDLVLPMAVADAPVDPYTLANVDRLAIMINGLIDKMSFQDCIMCVNNDFLESFYYMNPKSNVIEEIENVIVKTDLSPEERNLVAFLHTVPFVREVFLYTVINNPTHELVACNIVNLTISETEPPCPLGELYCPPHGARYKVLIPYDLVNDVSLQQSILDRLTTYYDSTISDVKRGVYDNTRLPNLPNYLKDYIQ